MLFHYSAISNGRSTDEGLTVDDVIVTLPDTLESAGVFVPDEKVAVVRARADLL